MTSGQPQTGRDAPAAFSRPTALDASSPDGRAAIDSLIERFGVAIDSFLVRAGKAQHVSDQFDLRRRALTGSYCYFEHLPATLRILQEVTTPEALGEHGRGICGSPIGPQIHCMIWSYLIARENEIGLGRSAGAPEDLALVLDWWSRMTTVYRADGFLLPHEAGQTLPSAPPELVTRTLAEHVLPSGARSAVSKLTAGLQLYQYVLRGEQRGTIFFHGPYPDGNGSAILVEEFTRMRFNELPWSPEAGTLPYDSVAAILRVPDVAFEFDIFAGMTADPVDYSSHVTEVALVTRDGGTTAPITEAEIPHAVAAMDAAKRIVFRETLQWTPDFRVAYGAYHYLDFLVPFLEETDTDPAAIVNLRRQFEETVARRLPEILAAERLPVWERLFERTHPLFSGVAA
jgi:hypothetical protein